MPLEAKGDLTAFVHEPAGADQPRGQASHRRRPSSPTTALPRLVSPTCSSNCTTNGSSLRAATCPREAWISSAPPSAPKPPPGYPTPPTRPPDDRLHHRRGNNPVRPDTCARTAGSTPTGCGRRPAFGQRPVSAARRPGRRRCPSSPSQDRKDRPQLRAVDFIEGRLHLRWSPERICQAPLHGPQEGLSTPLYAGRGELRRELAQAPAYRPHPAQTS